MKLAELQTELKALRQAVKALEQELAALRAAVQPARPARPVHQWDGKGEPF